jgi:Zn-dependent protease with chaperone function/tetratricopeptide (TPR) repeat protein
MKAILLLLLLAQVAQPDGDESTRVVQQLSAQINEAAQRMADKPDEAIRLLNALLDDPEARKLEAHSPMVRLVREDALYLRGEIQLEHGQAEVVADDMTALLESKRGRFGARVAGLVGQLASPQPDASFGAALNFPPHAPLSRVDWLTALELRAEAYEKLGQHDKAQADRAETSAIGREMTPGTPHIWYPQPERRPGWLEWITGDPAWLVPHINRPLYLAATFVVMVPVFFLMGLRQRREAGGTWRRLLGVSLALAALQTAPVLAAFLLVWWRPLADNLLGLLYVTTLVFGINVARHRSYLAAVRWKRSGGTPPRLEDPVVLGRIAQIAGRLGIAPPVTRLVRSSTVLQTNNALVTGLAAPTMVLFDGVLYRLTEEERDAIIAHELAHLANHTFWYRVVGAAACSTAVVAAAAFYYFPVALGLGAALVTGTWLILSRWLELDCDRRAARVIGHRMAASALWKIHADQPFRGLVEFLIGAVNSHPSRDQRLAAIYRDAPDGDRPTVEWDWRLLGRRRLAAWTAVGLWLSVIAGCLVWGYRWPHSNWPALPPVLMDVPLFVLFWLGLRKTARSRRRLQRKRFPWRRRLAWLVVLLMAGFVAAHIFGLTKPYLGELASGVILLGGGVVSLVVFVWLVRSNRAKKLNLQLVVAIQSGDYSRALALCEGSAKVVAGSTELRYNYALIRAVLGRRAEALEDLERLRSDDPGFKMTWLLLANLYAEEGEYARALEIAAQLSRDLPGERAGLQAESWLLRKVGRLEEAEARAREVLKMDPQSGMAHLTLAAVAVDRGDHAAAREQLARAERLVPGSVTAALLAAEIALATANGEEAAVHQAVSAAKNNPLSFADKEVARLVQCLEARRQVSAPESVG